MSLGLENRLPDVSEWIVGDRLIAEEKAWAEVKAYLRYADLISIISDKFSIQSIVEVGCGTGWVPWYLQGQFEYLGLDKNSECLELARKKNPKGDIKFELADIRAYDLTKRYDLVCSFAVLKHFGLHEWESIVAKVLSLADYGLFTQPVSLGQDKDLGVDWHYTWVSEAKLRRAVESAGHEIVSRTVFLASQHGEESDIVTRRV